MRTSSARKTSRRVASKNRRHGAHNPRALLHASSPSAADIAGARDLFDNESPLEHAMVVPAACGAAAAVLVSEARCPPRAKLYGGQAVLLAGQALRCDTPDSFPRGDDTPPDEATLANI